MKTTRTYLSGCTWCTATGFRTDFGLTASTIICPVCSGAKTVLVTESIEDHITTADLKDLDQARDDYYNRPKLFERK